MADKPWTGATNRFPEGILNEHDEGEIQMGITHDPEKGVVILDFGKPISWLGFPPTHARRLANLLRKHAYDLDGKT